MACAVAAFLFTIVNAILALLNQSADVQVARRRDFIIQSAQFARVNQALANGLGQAAVNDGDDALRQLLANNGFTIQAPGAPNTPARAP